ncbi:MAG: ABC transporter permease [Chloroflexi bacterium]|nr:ABC transporter permease [Chloroflexota bacterium]
MLPYLRRRMLVAALTLLGIATVVFALVRLLPGDPAQTMLARSGATAAEVAALRAELALDRPLAVQYLGWLAGLLRGDLGRSLFFGRPVLQLVGEQLPHSMALATGAMLVALAMGLPMGLAAARWEGRWPDRFVSLLAVGGVSVPVFWSGILMIWLFSVQLRWLPSAGSGDLRTLVMPSLVLGFGSAGPIARLGRAALLESLGEPYVVAARGRGLSERQVFLRHVLRNALIPLLTIAGLQVSFLLGSTVITETVFNRPGIGRLLVDAILWRDLPLVQGVALVVAGFYVTVSLVVDAAAAVVDPRVVAS